ncbi:MAG TPA: N-acetylmuramoyl-L-alanine amidase [Pseudonocardiaceae bacterium]
MRVNRRLVSTLTVAATALAVGLPVTAGAQDASAARQQQFAAAAQEFGVPQSVLLALSYNESLWETHNGAPSTTGDYGPMALTDVATGLTDKGTPSTAGLHTLITAAALIGATPAAVKSDPADNIRGAAALLAQYAKKVGDGILPTSVDDWYGAVAEYSGSADTSGAKDFADDVYTTIRTGASRRTDDGQNLSLPADPSVAPNTGQLAALHLAPPPPGQQPQCPTNLACTFIPAAYAEDSSSTDYGNYDLADRPNNGLSINYIVIHDTEETYAATVSDFQNPSHYSSANYVVRGSNGTVTQMVPDSDVAWHAGNWYVNMHAVGIEQEGFAVQGATWFTERLYQTTAKLVRYLAARYQVPLDRQHIIGHDNVPGPSPAGIPGMHWDPGPFWNWNHFMNLLGSYIVPTGSSHSPVVTINPSFATNIQNVTDCENNTPVAAQAASFVYLRTAPNANAPLYNDPGLNPTGTVGTTCAADWGDKASSGQQFTVAGRSGDWIAIWWDGAKVWFENPAGKQVVTDSSALVVEPRPGETSVPVYGSAYPEASAYPSAIPVQSLTPLPYTVQAGQSYVYGGRTPTDYYYAQSIDNSIPDDHTDVPGTQRYLEIQLGHRIAFVLASQVQLVPAVG